MKVSYSGVTHVEAGEIGSNQRIDIAPAINRAPLAPAPTGDPGIDVLSLHRLRRSRRRRRGDVWVDALAQSAVHWSPE